MVIPNTCPNLSDIVQTDFELGRVIQTVVAAGITVLYEQAPGTDQSPEESVHRRGRALVPEGSTSYGSGTHNG